MRVDELKSRAAEGIQWTFVLSGLAVPAAAGINLRRTAGSGGALFLHAAPCLKGRYLGAATASRSIVAARISRDAGRQVRM